MKIMPRVGKKRVIPTVDEVDRRRMQLHWLELVVGSLASSPKKWPRWWLKWGNSRLTLPHQHLVGVRPATWGPPWAGRLPQSVSEGWLEEGPNVLARDNDPSWNSAVPKEYWAAYLQMPFLTPDAWDCPGTGGLWPPIPGACHCCLVGIHGILHGNMCVLHAKHVIIMPKDIKLACQVRGSNLSNTYSHSSFNSNSSVNFNFKF